MDRSRAIVVGLICFAVPIVLISAVLAAQRSSAASWAAVFVVLIVGYGLLVSVVVLSSRSGTRGVLATRAAHPDALLVCRALDEQVRPRGVRTLVVDGTGISLVNGRGHRLKACWSLEWNDVAAAEASAANFRTGNKPALLIHTTVGQTKVIGLVSSHGLRHSPEETRSAAALITSHGRL
jgi:hypothetical protein